MIFGFDGCVYTSLLRCEGYQGSLVFDTGSTITLFSAGAFKEFSESEDIKEEEVKKWALGEFEKWLLEQNPDTNQTKTADGRIINLYLCYARDVLISDTNFDRLYFFLALNRSNIVLLGDDVINYTDVTKEYTDITQFEIECRFVDAEAYKEKYYKTNAVDLTWLFTEDLADADPKIKTLINKLRLESADEV